jgi:hypothetical protein
MKYEIAFSFAGEDREYVAEVAYELKKKKINIFYDEYEVATLWGKDLYQHLSKVYFEMAKYTVIFISDNYAKKLWAKHEFRNAQARAFKEAEEYILPVRFDDTILPGLMDTIGYIDLRNITPIQLSNIILEKLKLEQPSFEFDHKLISDNDSQLDNRYLLNIYLDMENYVVFNLERYVTLNEILDDLFIYYLKDKVKPYSYGSEWILLTEPSFKRVLAPLDWVTNKRKPISEIDPIWTKNVNLESIGISQGSNLYVNYFQFPLNDMIYGVLTNDYNLIHLLNTNAKAIALLINKFKKTESISIDLKNSYKYHQVYSDWLSVTKKPFLIHNGKPLDQKLIYRIIR